MSLPGRLNDRPGLNARSHLLGPDQVALQVDRFDYDAEVGDLREQVKKLKQVGLAIQEEAAEQGQLLQEMEELFERAQLNLKRAMRRANQVVQRSSRPHLVYVLLFVVVLLLSVYGYRWFQRHPLLKWLTIMGFGMLLLLGLFLKFRTRRRTGRSE